MVCDCKFWWAGERCDQCKREFARLERRTRVVFVSVGTSSGKQVIILSGLVALLIGGFYGALLVRCIRKCCKPVDTAKTE